MILDGFGINSAKENNAVLLAKMVNYRTLLGRYPSTTLDASEGHVGLPEGFMGNSEVGHLNIGAGRIVYQDFSLISRAIEKKTFFRNRRLLSVVESVKNSRGALHLMGLVSDGGVHSHISHLLALIDLAREEGISKIWVHAFTDGRDTDPRSGAEFVESVEKHLGGAGRVATVCGRFYAMDRDKRWERTERAFIAVARGAGSSYSVASEFVTSSYSNATDEFIEPGVLAGYSGIKNSDGVIFFNFRADRARQLIRALTQNEFAEFDRGQFKAVTRIVTMTPYDPTFSLLSAYEKTAVKETLGEIVSNMGWRQLRIAETEKYAHVTYFFNGGVEAKFPGEERVLIPSPREVRTYDLKPEMAAREVTDKLLAELETKYQFVVVNFANPDMVGHTGVLSAAVKALEVVDECLGRIVDWVERHQAMAIITSDHGNCEKMVSDDGRVLTSHTLLPVPFVVIDPLRSIQCSGPGRLCDIAPTVLKLWGLKQPSVMTGRALVEIVP